MNITRSKTLFATLIVTSLAFLLSFLFSKTTLSEYIELRSFDLRAQFRAQKQTPHPDIAIVMVDEESLKALEPLAGRWPWPRSLFADLIDFFDIVETKTVLFDILFTESQKALSEESYRHDLALGESTRNHGSIFHSFQLFTDKEDEINIDLLNKPIPKIARDRYAIPHLSNKSYKWTQNHNNRYLPIESLLNNAKGIGVVNFEADIDGTFRRTKLVHHYHNHYYPNLGMSAILNRFGKKLSIKENLIQLSKHNIPISQEGNYTFILSQNFPTYSISGVFATLQQLANGQTHNLFLNPNLFKDKIVLVGTSAVGTYDLQNTSLGSNTPGVFTHASIINNIMKEEYYTFMPNWITYLTGIILSLISVSFILRTITLWGQLLPPTILGFSFLGLSFASIYYKLWVFELVFPILQLTIASVGSISYISLTEGKARRRTRKLLSQYVSPTVLSEVMDKTNNVLTAEVGSKENLTVFFSDIRGFTSLSERVDPEQTVEMLNYYLHQMVDIVFQHNGTLDKFIGDAVMAFWGAPLHDSNHAQKAVYSALEMRKQMASINDYFEKKGYPHFKIGMGLNSGPVILGNIGSEKKLDYTVIGDNVNLTSRIEGLTKQYGCDILLSQPTYDYIKKEIPCRIIDLVKVKGKTKPIAIYHPLVSPKDDEKEIKKAKKIDRLVLPALESYENKEWDNAMSLYSELKSQYPDDILYPLFIERCLQYKKHPPSSSWDGSYTAKTK